MQRLIGTLFGLVMGLGRGACLFGARSRTGSADPRAGRWLRPHPDGGRRDRDRRLAVRAPSGPSLVPQAPALAHAARGADQLATMVAILKAVPARGQEARPRDPIHPRSAATGSAVPRASQDDPGDLGLSAPGSGATRQDRRSGGRALAGQGSLRHPAVDRADHRPDRAPGLAREPVPAGGQAGQPVRAPRRHHRQGQLATFTTATSST